MNVSPNVRTPTEIVTTLPAVPSGGGLVAAIAAVMNEVHVVAKRGENEFHRYRYATMGDILKEITPLLGRHGIVIFQSETGRAMFDDDNGSPSNIPSPWPMPRARPGRMSSSRPASRPAATARAVGTTSP
jgi:hypothetical protein